MKIFHTSPEKITEINAYGTLGSCLCFSNGIYQMSEASTNVYSLDLDESEIIEASSFFYREDCELLNSIVKEIMDLAGCDEDTAQDLLAQKESFCGDPEIDWRIQGYTGEAARVLGFKAALAQDEQGEVYIVSMLDRESELFLESE